ncbi:hypothetical protein BT67DRAFT_111660 [Trichocladium antarcticum]|uniref:Uncharacterized protein n=1 Tax=Trichocladium antarcticum TaxID=1450529 RepID=A0AAN6UTA7_9PEZI|nr:hypothetical protein BT67DRAFT_111660 [Trichocladium antarcticum]
MLGSLTSKSLLHRSTTRPRWNGVAHPTHSNPRRSQASSRTARRSDSSEVNRNDVLIDGQISCPPPPFLLSHQLRPAIANKLPGTRSGTHLHVHSGAELHHAIHAAIHHRNDTTRPILQPPATEQPPRRSKPRSTPPPMATLHQPPAPQPPPQQQQSRAPAMSSRALASTIIGSVFAIGCAVVVLALLLSRRRDKRRRGGQHLAAIDDDDDAVVFSSSRGARNRWSEEAGLAPRRKLQKACSMGAWPSSSSSSSLKWEKGVRAGHRSMPLIPRVFAGRLGRSQSCKWPPTVEGGLMGVCRATPSWIDEDALHGPKMGGPRPTLPVGAGRRKKKRGSWPLRNRVPTIPRLHHTIHGYPSERLWDEEALTGGGRSAPDYYMQLRALSSVLPRPPVRALVVNKDRQVVRPSVRVDHAYAKKESQRLPRPGPSPVASPVRSLPRTPSKPRGRQPSSDSTLSEILKSTEKRLRAGSLLETDKNNRLSASPTRVFGPREYGVPRSQIRTPSPRKMARRQSQQSVSSETDSLVAEECPAPDAPSGLTSPSRNQRKQDPARQAPKVPQVQSARSSISSELSTLYSEDEMPEEVRKAIVPLEGFMVQPQRATNVGPPTMNDPFVTVPLPFSASRASIGHALPTRQHKAHDLFGESREQSQRLGRMMLGQRPVQSQGLILAPPPAAYGTRPSSTTGNLRSRRVSVTINSPVQPYLAYPSRASEPPPPPPRQSPTSKSPKGPLFLRLTKTSTLSTIPLLPPPAAPGLDIFRDAAPRTLLPTTARQQTEEQPRRSPTMLLPSTERSSAPSSPTRRAGGNEMRLSLVLSPQQHPTTNRTSVSTSSIYSQEPPAVLNRASFHANSLLLASLYPAPLCPKRRRSSNNKRPRPRPLPLQAKPSGELPLLAATTTSDDAAHEDSDGNGNGNGSDGDNDAGPQAIATTIASLRRMNSGISTASSLRSIPDRNATPSDGRASPAAAAAAAAAAVVVVVDSPVTKAAPRGDRKSMMGARNYFTMGSGGGGQSRRGSRVVSGVVGAGVIKVVEGRGVVRGGSAGGGRGAGLSPCKRQRRPGSVRSGLLRMEAVEAGGGDEGKENEGPGGGFKMVAGEVTFVAGGCGTGSGGLGLREGSAGSLNMLVVPPQQPRPLSLSLSLPWKTATRRVSRNVSPVRPGECPSRGSLKSVESGSLYDGQGFLISASPVRGPSPALRV